MIKAYFSGIKDLLIEKINQSTTSIMIAVAWFTQRDLFNAIINALERNVSVSLIIIDDIINRNEYGLDFSIYLKEGGKLCLANSKKILMHNKFCLFDNKIIITGSYNWTYAAEIRNEENIIISDDQEVCNEFETHFHILWKILSEITEYKHIETSDSRDRDFIKLYDDLFNEYSLMVAKNIISSSAIDNIQQHKDNIAITKLATLTTISHRKNPVAKLNIGTRCRINGIDDRVLLIIPEGHSLPYTNTVESCTVYDNQSQILCEVVFGNSNNANENESLTKILMEGLPLLKATQVKMKTKITLDTNGYMHVEFVCQNNGIAKEAVYINPKLIDYK